MMSYYSQKLYKDTNNPASMLGLVISWKKNIEFIGLWQKL